MQKNCIIIMLICSFILSLIFGCESRDAKCQSTKYIPLGSNVIDDGYFHQRLAPDVYCVNFKGNSCTPYRQAYDYTLLRAAEIGKHFGYSYFAIEGQADNSRRETITLGGTTTNSGYLTGNAHSYGGGVLNARNYSGSSDTSFSGNYYGTSNTTFYNVPILRPGINLTVRYFQEKPTSDYLDIYDIDSTMINVKNKYVIRKKRTPPKKELDNMDQLVYGDVAPLDPNLIPAKKPITNEEILKAVYGYPEDEKSRQAKDISELKEEIREIDKEVYRNY